MYKIFFPKSLGVTEFSRDLRPNQPCHYISRETETQSREEICRSHLFSIQHPFSHRVSTQNGHRTMRISACSSLAVQASLGQYPLSQTMWTESDEILILHVEGYIVLYDLGSRTRKPADHHPGVPPPVKGLSLTLWVDNLRALSMHS